MQVNECLAYSSRYLFSIYTPGHGPGGGDVVHDPLAQALGDLVQLQEVPHAVQHLVVAVGVGVHLLEDGRHVTKDGGVEEGCFRGKKGYFVFSFNAMGEALGARRTLVGY